MPRRRADEMLFVLDHTETRFAVAEVACIIYKHPRGLCYYPQDVLRSLAFVQQQGGAFDAAHPDFFLSEVAEGSGIDLSVTTYTSETMGGPKA
jgi:long-chain acyl-CoA synthetase